MATTPSPKRMFAVKILLSETEAFDLHRWAAGEDRKPADMARKGLLLSMYGSLGLAERRNQRKQGDAQSPTVMHSLDAADFQESEFGDMGQL